MQLFLFLFKVEIRLTCVETKPFVLLRNVFSGESLDFRELENTLDVAVRVRAGNVVRSGHDLEGDVLSHALERNDILNILTIFSIHTVLIFCA